MTRTRYSAVPLDSLSREGSDTAVILAATDLAAAAQAMLHFGPDTPFVLWEGERRVLMHQPLAHLLHKRGFSVPSSTQSRLSV